MVLLPQGPRAKRWTGVAFKDRAENGFCVSTTVSSQILRTLQKRGFVLREKIEGDEREKHSSLSPAGKNLAKIAAEIMKTK